MPSQEILGVFEAYEKAREAWDAIPKDFFRRDYFEETNTMRLSCPRCGVIYAELQYGQFYTFNMPIFCCGKMLA